MSELDRLAPLPFLNQLRMRLEQTENLFLVRHLFAVVAMPRDGNDSFHPRKVSVEFRDECHCQFIGKRSQCLGDLLRLRDRFACTFNDRVVMFADFFLSLRTLALGEFVDLARVKAKVR